MKLAIELPVFNGFYGTFFECDCEENEIEEGQKYEDYNFDYADYHERVSKACVSAVETKLNEINFKCTLTFIELISPKFYNYTNDCIKCEIDFKFSDLQTLIKECDREGQSPLYYEFEAFLEENFKSRSGFTSFYEYDVNTWVNEYLRKKYKNLDLCLSNFLTFYLSMEEFTDVELSNTDDVSQEMAYVSSSLIEC